MSNVNIDRYMPHVNNIPYDLLKMILFYFPGKLNLSIISLVCKKWCRIIYDVPKLRAYVPSMSHLEYEELLLSIEKNKIEYIKEYDRSIFIRTNKLTPSTCNLLGIKNVENWVNKYFHERSNYELDDDYELHNMCVFIQACIYGKSEVSKFPIGKVIPILFKICKVVNPHMKIGKGKLCDIFEVNLTSSATIDIFTCMRLKMGASNPCLLSTAVDVMNSMDIDRVPVHPAVFGYFREFGCTFLSIDINEVSETRNSFIANSTCSNNVEYLPKGWIQLARNHWNINNWSKSRHSLSVMNVIRHAKTTGEDYSFLHTSILRYQIFSSHWKLEDVNAITDHLISFLPFSDRLVNVMFVMHLHMVKHHQRREIRETLECSVITDEDVAALQLRFGISVTKRDRGDGMPIYKYAE